MNGRRAYSNSVKISPSSLTTSSMDTVVPSEQAALSEQSALSASVRIRWYRSILITAPVTVTYEPPVQLLKFPLGQFNPAIGCSCRLAYRFLVADEGVERSEDGSAFCDVHAGV